MHGRNNKSSNAWFKNDTRFKSSSKPNNSEVKFKEVHRKFQEAVKKHTIDYNSSSEEEELQINDIIESTFKSYAEIGGANDNLNRTNVFLTDTATSGVKICVICISSVKRTDNVWNCEECFSIFHLMCIQRWSKDTVFQLKKSLSEGLPVKNNLKVVWDCPKCRQHYDSSDIPDKYLCFCKKTVNPTFQPLLIPHSCGETCHKDLKPFCGHKCLLLCHPGPCPPCPQTVDVTCYCGRKPSRTQRCNNRKWSCGTPCEKLLSCKNHKCSQLCHGGECEPCLKKSIQKCICGAKSKLRDCSTPVWQCDQVCNKLLECGNHTCLAKCHVGTCGFCTLTQPRTCPCGKTTFTLECTEDTPTCGDTCDKLLECGVHICFQRCHKDKCGMCLEVVRKTCRCGLHTKEVQCKKDYLCETKCKKLKDCYKHPCNRKCCEGNCPPCEKPCGRTLGCGNHKCISVCHRGSCYPCHLAETVSCRCGGTSVTVPCGRKKKTRPPRCLLLCKIRPNCHHEQREKHNCHFNSCPPCRQICNKKLTSCTHKCPVACHSSVLVRIEGQKGSMPWEQIEPQLVQKSLPCPDCIVSVPVTCLGKHETADWPCHLAKTSSCGRPCGRKLECGNHDCSLACHLVEDANDEKTAGTNCLKCTSPCSKPRPKGCFHSCLKPCHPGDCSPCKQMVRIKCLCGLNQPYVLCSTWTSSSNKEELESCGNQCPKNYPCGHRCRSNCHAGECRNSELCKKRVKITCSCKRIKKEFSCEEFRSTVAMVKCDEVCQEKQREEKKARDLANERKRKEEELKNKIELEKYEKLLHGKKKSKERRVINQTEEVLLIRKYWMVAVSLVVVVVGVYFMFFVRGV
ncbi:hypothetical protein FQR65_LT05337 [Abscondita terminalis]|nr:hypothetical protein FQR65_LT05337 [Abscondita terminalis]